MAFSELIVDGFLWVFQFPPALNRSMVSVTEIIPENTCDFNSLKCSSRAIPLQCAAHKMMCMMSTRCLARDLHTAAS